eukprot:195952_1
MALATSVEKTDNNIADAIQNTTVRPEDIWTSSTHSYFFSSESSCADKFVASIVLLFQYFMYFVMVLWTTTSHSDLGIVYWEGVDDYEQDLCGNMGHTFDDLHCLSHSTEGIGSGPAIMVVFTLLLCFIMPDIFKAFKSFSHSCLFAILIIIEGVFGLFAAAYIGYDASKEVNADLLNPMLATVGILFVHDIDEKVFGGVKHSSDCGKIIFIVSILVIAGVVQVMYTVSAS